MHSFSSYFCTKLRKCKQQVPIEVTSLIYAWRWVLHLFIVLNLLDICFCWMYAYCQALLQPTRVENKKAILNILHRNKNKLVILASCILMNSSCSDPLYLLLADFQGLWDMVWCNYQFAFITVTFQFSIFLGWFFLCVSEFQASLIGSLFPHLFLDTFLNNPIKNSHILLVGWNLFHLMMSCLLFLLIII